VGKKIIVTQAADVALSTSGDHSVIPARADKIIKVWKLFLIAEGAVNLKMSHGIPGGSVSYFNSRAHHLTQDGSNVTFAYDDEPYYTTAAGEEFGINLSGSVGLSGQIYFSYEP
jgi:hypothetical protein